MTKRPIFTAEKEELDRYGDWLTALSPLLMMMVVNYGWTAVWTVLCAAVGYLGGMKLWHLVRVTSFHPVPALVCGVLVACCLPTQSPLWLSALAGLVGAVVSGIPPLMGRVVKRVAFVCPVYLPALVGYLTVRWAFADRFARVILPAMGVRADVVAGATPLVTMGADGVTTERLHWMFWGYESGSMGSGPALALFFGCAYLLLRRRVQPLPMAGMLLVVAGAFQWRWGTPAFGLLAGGTLLAAMLLGDGVLLRMERREKWIAGTVAGVIAGAVTVFYRMRWAVDGAAVGVLVACLLTTVAFLLYPVFWRLVRYLREKFAKSEN